MENNKNKSSLVNADAEQAQLLALESRLAPVSKGSNLAVVIIFFAFIFIFAALFWALPDKEASAEENRSLQSFPTFTREKLIDGTFTEEFGEYMADQFPFRNFFVGMKGVAETALLKGENNGVIKGADGYLITRYDSVDTEILENNLDCISVFLENAEEKGFDVTVAFAGRTCDVAVSKMKKLYGSETSDKTWEELYRISVEKDVPFCDLMTPLRERMEKGEYVYYKTDHHWTTLGALYAYDEIAVKADLPYYDKEEFEVETVSEEFYGTTWSKAGIKWAKPDSLEYFRYDGDEELFTSIKNGEEFNTVYKREHLDTKDKYASFIGGNNARTDVTDGTGEREKLLLVKDSFAHSTVPFFARNYDLVIIDLRYYSSSIIKLMEEEGIEKAVLLYNMETLSSESGFRIFKMK